MPIDLSNLVSNVNSAANVILVNPKKNVGIKPQDSVNRNSASSNSFVNAIASRIVPSSSGGFLFHINGEETSTLTSDITDHFVENNTAIQDHIALKPEIITASGYIGELNNVPPPALELLKETADRLATLSPFVPTLSESAIRAYNTAAQAFAAAELVKNTAVSAWNTISGGESNPVQNKQQNAYNLFYGYWRARQLFTVQTPWAIFKNMAIQSLRASQDEDTRMITHFEITFKKIRFAKSVVSVTKEGNGRVNEKLAKLVDKGVSKPVQSISLLGKLGVA